MVVFRTEDLLFFFFFEIAPSVKPLPLQNFACPQTIRSGYVPERTATFFLNDVIFAMKSHAVKILYVTSFLEPES